MVSADDFFDATPELAHVRDFARSRRTAPWGTLGVVLVRTTCALEPHVVLPPLTGSYASLNLFVGLVGRSGGGKGAAEGAARDAVTFDCHDDEPLPTPTVGSAEGIGKVYWRWNGKAGDDGNPIGWERRTTRAMFRAAEVDTLAAVSGRTGSPLLPRLRDAWLGDDLSFAYADAAKSPPVHPHTYRLGLVVGVQPRRAGVIIGDADGGTPQRFLWLPTTDRDAPEVRPDQPGPIQWKRSKATEAIPGLTAGFELQAIEVCQKARQAVDQAALLRLTAPYDEHALDGHALMARLKVAAALGTLHHQPAVTDEWWQLAGVVMAVSNATRAGVVAEMRRADKERNEARGAAEGQRSVAAREVLERDAIRRVSQRVLRLIGERGTTGHADLRRQVAGRDRAVFDRAIEALLETGQVEASTTGDRTDYRVAS